MAKAKKSVVATDAPAVPNLFAKAAKAAADKPKKEKGTIIQLPKDLDTEGKLIGQSAALNKAVSNAIEAKAEEDAAKTKGTIAKNAIVGFAQNEVVKLYAKLGVPPATPVSVVNHNGESVTYVMADKSQQNAIGAEQVSLLETILGADAAAKIISKRTIVSFNFETMGQQAANATDKTVFDIVAEIVSKALMADPRLSTEQKESLIVSAEKTYLQVGTLQRIAELCGSDAGKIGQFYEAIGSACVRSLKI